MTRLLIATTNPAKREEITYGLQDLVNDGLEILTLQDVQVEGEPVESADTFEGNAKIKAQFYGDQTGLPTISDDGGLMIDALNGAPGVKSRRWPGYEATDEELITYALDKMNDVPEGKRTAQLVTCVCLYDPVNKQFTTEQESIKGKISAEPLTMDTNGYPYRALFIVDKYDKFYDELSKAEHHEINHRLKALRKLSPAIHSRLM